MTHFRSLIAGLNRKGESLTEDQQSAIRAFFGADAVSPRFVKRVLGEYGDESVKAAFLLKAVFTADSGLQPAPAVRWTLSGEALCF